MSGEGTRLSCCDHIQPPFPVRTVYVFRTPEIQTVQQWQEASISLRASFIGFVERYMPRLTGRMYRDKGSGGVLRLVEDGSRPPVFVSHATEEWVPRTEDLRSGNTVDWPFEKILDFSYAEDEELPAGETHGTGVKVRATWCHSEKESFVVFVQQFHHEFGDAATIVMFPNWWSEFHRTGTVAVPPMYDPTPLYGKPREGGVLPPSEQQQVDMARYSFYSASSMMDSDQKATSEWATVRFRFAAEELEQVQKRLDHEMPMGGKERFTKNDVAVAMTWRAFYRGGRQPALLPGVAPLSASGREQPCVMMPCNVRGRREGVPMNFCGNALVSSCARVDSEEKLFSSTLAELALTVHQTVRRAIRPDVIQSFLDWETALPTREPGMLLPSLESPSLSSWANFPMYAVNFGPQFAGGNGPELSTNAPGAQIPGLGCFVPPPPLCGVQGIDLIVCVCGEVHATAMMSGEEFNGKRVGRAV